MNKRLLQDLHSVITELESRNYVREATTLHNVFLKMAQADVNSEDSSLDYTNMDDDARDALMSLYSRFKYNDNIDPSLLTEEDKEMLKKMYFYLRMGKYSRKHASSRSSNRYAALSDDLNSTGLGVNSEDSSLDYTNIDDDARNALMSLYSRFKYNENIDPSLLTEEDKELLKKMYFYLRMGKYSRKHASSRSGSRYAALSDDLNSTGLGVLEDGKYQIYYQSVRAKQEGSPARKYIIKIDNSDPKQKVYHSVDRKTGDAKTTLWVRVLEAGGEPLIGPDGEPGDYRRFSINRDHFESLRPFGAGRNQLGRFAPRQTVDPLFSDNDVVSSLRPRNRR